MHYAPPIDDLHGARTLLCSLLVALSEFRDACPERAGEASRLISGLNVLHVDLIRAAQAEDPEAWLRACVRLKDVAFAASEMAEQSSYECLETIAHNRRASDRR